MSEEQTKRGRPRKQHLQQDHHFATAGTLDNDASEGAPSVASDASQESASQQSLETSPDSALSEPEMLAPVIDARPIEPSIPKIISSYNWKTLDTEIVIELPPRNGMPVMLTNDISKPGIKAFWKRTRKFANSTHQWQMTGKFIDWVTGGDLPFAPTHWRPANV